MDENSYFLTSTAYPDDITYCASEKCKRKDCVRHLRNKNRTKFVTSEKEKALPVLYSVAAFGEVCIDYTED